MKTLHYVIGLAAAGLVRRAGAPAFQWRALISVITLLGFVSLLVSGTCLSIAPPGRIANWNDWTILGLRKAQWQDLHLSFGMLFVAASVLHAALNWRKLLSYFRGRLSRQFGFRREWVAAVIFCAGIFVATRLEIPPVSSFLTFTESIRQSWEERIGRPPIPHAELLSLHELTEQLGLDLAGALKRLEGKGIHDLASDIRLAELSERNGVPVDQLFRMMTGEANGRTQRVGQSSGRPGPGGGSGYGRRTLAEVCEREGIDLETATKRLKAAGVQGAPDLTVRELAEQSGSHKPYEILRILSGGQAERLPK